MIFGEIVNIGIFGGALLALDHYSRYGRWKDRDKKLCHGRIGQYLFFSSVIVRIFLK